MAAKLPDDLASCGLQVMVAIEFAQGLPDLVRVGPAPSGSGHRLGRARHGERQLVLGELHTASMPDAPLPRKLRDAPETSPSSGNFATLRL